MSIVDKKTKKQETAKEEEPKEKIELTPEQEADEKLMQEFLDDESDIEEINFGL